MKIALKYILFVVLFGCLSPQLMAQVPLVSEQEVLIELAKRGLDEDEVRLALIKKGIDLNNLDELTPDGVRVIEETILELERIKQEEEQLLQNENPDKFPIDPNETDIDSSEIEAEIDSTLIEEPLEELPEALIYGHDLFRNQLIRVIKGDENFKAPSNYVIGAGDELSISIWGKSQLDGKFMVNKDGYITVINNSQRVLLKGLTLGKAREKLFNVLSKSYNFNEGQFDVDLNYARTVSVNVYGEVFNVGPVTLPSINTAFSALSEAKGPNDIGSVRMIQLIRADGRKAQLDVYKYMNDPSAQSDLFLQDNDIILVPVAGNLVEIQGRIRRPMKYELLESEGLKELLDYAGGFSDDAYTNTIRIKRFQSGIQKVLDVNWNDVSSGARKFELYKGDLVIVDSISVLASNFVEIEGEVINPGVFERNQQMRVSDLIKKAGLKPESRTDVAFIKRTNLDGTTTYKQININDILNNINSEENITLEDKDLLTIWSQNRYADESRFMINGAVRFPGDFPFDVSQNIQISEAIILAGGLRRDASDVAVIHRRDPLNPKILEYITIDNLEKVLEEPSIGQNFTLNAFDSLVVYSKNTFQEESFVRVEGAVNSPGLYQYGKEMTLQDLMTLAGGFKLAAATNNIEISRVVIRNNEPTRIVIANIDMERDLKTVNDGNEYYKLEPFDNVSVRYVPEFELQQNVVLSGEVKFPGHYTIINENETISSIVKRAGGLTEEGFPAGATLIRSDQDYGAVVIKLNEILRNPNSQFNFTVRDGDTINVPKIKEFVTIKGATRAKDVLSIESINDGNIIHVPFHRGKDATFYINEYAGGLADNADPNAIFVEHPNGEVKEAKRNIIFRKKVEVRKGSIIRVGYKPLKKEGEKDRQDVDWTKVLSDSVGQAMSILTLILLISRLD